MPAMAPSGTLASSLITNSKDLVSKRKRTNRSAKLKQCKFEARREQWLSHPVTDGTQADDILHAETDASINDPGEVIHPEPAEKQTLLSVHSKISWASLLNSTISAQMQQNSHRTHPVARVLPPQSEPDPELARASSNPCGNLKIKRTNQKDMGRDTSPGSTRDGSGDTDASPKSYGDRSPKSKASKVGRGSRRSRGRVRSSKENEFFGTENNLESRGQQRQFEGLHGRARGREHGQYCMDQTEDGWEAAADALGLHIKQKKFSNVLQPQAPPGNDPQRTRTLPAPLLGLKPSKQQQNAHGRAWMHGDSRRPSSLPSPAKQRSSGVDPPICVNEASERPECLICAENLDSTDTSFDACECRFKICLFCYHKIEQEDGRCPGCRGVYKQNVSAKPACVLPR